MIGLDKLASRYIGVCSILLWGYVKKKAFCYYRREQDFFGHIAI
jgi:hypothetical protein